MSTKCANILQKFKAHGLILYKIYIILKIEKYWFLKSMYRRKAIFFSQLYEYFKSWTCRK